jgi:hypothetical protein
MDISGPVDIFEIVELYFPDRVMRQFNYRQHIPVNIDMNDALHAINHQWDTQRNDIFT